jgi:hypothetical protein
MKRHHVAGLGLATAIFCALAQTAAAADRTVCYRLQLRDDRNSCPTAGTTGARRPCNPGGYADAVGHQLELWDKDSDSDDELIGTWYVGGGGRRCITFPWEGQAYHKGEAHPDVYVRYINLVNRTGFANYVRVRAVQTDGSAHAATSWRNGQPGDPERYVAQNCQAGRTCDIFPSGSLVPTNDPASLRALRIMALDTAQHALQVFGEDMDRHIDLHYPGKSSCATSCAVDREEIHIAQSLGDDGFNVAHEVGHVVQMQEFDQDDLRNDCSRSGSGHSLTSLEHESCATTEGFAGYASIVSWWEPNNSGTNPATYGQNFEAATPALASCTDSAHTELQVAKGFWDLDDFNNEAGAGAAAGFDDRLAYATDAITRGWRQFPDGTGNGEDFESGADGVNMRDYWSNNSSRFTAAGAFETLIQHNCLSAQTSS